MDWPTASVLIGVLGTIAVAILRVTPAQKRSNADVPMEIAVLKAQHTTLSGVLVDLRKEIRHRLERLEKKIDGLIKL